MLLHHLRLLQSSMYRHVTPLMASSSRYCIEINLNGLFQDLRSSDLHASIHADTTSWYDRSS